MNNTDVPLSPVRVYTELLAYFFSFSLVENLDKHVVTGNDLTCLTLFKYGNVRFAKNMVINGSQKKVMLVIQPT